MEETVKSNKPKNDCIYRDACDNCNNVFRLNSKCEPDSCVLYCSPEDHIKVMPKDNVNHPDHYTQGGIECIKAIEASMPPEGFQDYCKGNCLKYIWRWREKNGIEDLKKAQVYLNWMIESAEKEEDNAE